MDQFDQQYFLYQRLADYQNIPNIELIWGDRAESTWTKTAKLLRWLNTVSEEALETAILINAPEKNVKTLGLCYQLYQQQLEAENALDFSTIQFEAIKVIAKSTPSFKHSTKQN
ncbi:ATP-dependent DNA helicase UvrD/PcrA (plasmid) [Geminocystis sp. NIES-3708]|nr:hypothetical protein [Geminocystis sp. NIES-3708]BAQ63134.1 ATP-dependent DNA helicase UvrD/PcrA [Geminocystis sp. NIES-3708]